MFKEFTMQNKKLKDSYAVLQSAEVVLDFYEACANRDYAMIRRSGDCCIAIKYEKAKDYKKAMFDVYSEVVKKENLVSFKMFVVTIDKLIIDNTQNLHQALMDSLSQLDIKTYRFICPMYEGFKLRNDNVITHGKYTFVPQSVVREYLANTNRHYESESLLFEDKSKSYFCYFDFECVAKDFTKAFEVFELEYKRVVKCLAFIFCDNNIHNKLGVFNDKLQIIGGDFIVSCSDGFRSESRSYDKNSVYFNVFVDGDNRWHSVENRFYDESNQQFDDDKGNYRIWELLNKPNHNELEKRLLRAIEWIGMAISEKEPSIAFIQCAFAIECLLQNDGGFITKGITAQISEYAAFIVGCEKESRQDVASTFVKLYSIRSAIAHGQNKELLDNELQEIIWLSKQIVINFLLKPELKCINSTKALKEYIESKRYSN